MINKSLINTSIILASGSFGDEFLNKLLTLGNIKDTRLDFKEWLYFQFKEEDSPCNADSKYGFELFENPEKLTELMFLVVVPQAANL